MEWCFWDMAKGLGRKSCEKEGDRLMKSQGVEGPGEQDKDRSEEELYWLWSDEVDRRDESEGVELDRPWKCMTGDDEVELGWKIRAEEE